MKNAKPIVRKYKHGYMGAASVLLPGNSRYSLPTGIIRLTKEDAKQDAIKEVEKLI